MDLPRDTVLRVLKPLYGIPDSDRNWYPTYLDHRINHLGIFMAATDPSMLFKNDDRKLRGASGLQVDDTLTFNDDDFLKKVRNEILIFKRSRGRSSTLNPRPSMVRISPSTMPSSA